MAKSSPVFIVKTTPTIPKSGKCVKPGFSDLRQYKASREDNFNVFEISPKLIAFITSAWKFV